MEENERERKREGRNVNTTTNHHCLCYPFSLLFFPCLITGHMKSLFQKRFPEL